MYVRAYLLAGFGGAERSNYRNLRRNFTRLLRKTSTSSEGWVEACWRCLVIVETIQAEAEGIHDDMGAEEDFELQERSIMIANSIQRQSA